MSGIKNPACSIKCKKIKMTLGIFLTFNLFAVGELCVATYIITTLLYTPTYLSTKHACKYGHTLY